MRVLITGGAGFIGSAVARRFITEGNDDILIFDNLNYAGNLDSLAAVTSSPHYRFVRGDICDMNAVSKIFGDFRPDVVLHLAADSHVDRSIDKPAAFIQTNVVGTSVMLDCSLAHFRTLSAASAARFRFIHISTDEVFGSLGQTGFFTEHTPYAPNSPYSASKAGMQAMASCIRKEVRKHNIKICNIYPGAVETDMWDIKARQQFRNRMMTPADIGDIAFDVYNKPERLMVEDLVVRPVKGDL